MSRPPKQRALKGGRISSSYSDPSDRITDPRFANIQTDPLFRLPSRKSTRVTLDSRFAPLLSDERFSLRAKVDRYGRRLDRKRQLKGALGTNRTNRRKGKDTVGELERLYRIEGSGSGDDDGEEEEKKNMRDGDLEAESGDSETEVQRELSRVSKSYDPARDGGFSQSSSSEEDSSGSDTSLSEPESKEAVTLPDPAEIDVPAGEISSRLAVVGMDWDNMRAVDLLATLSSFAPPGNKVLDVAIYPSEFGKERMEKEELEGPPKEIFAIGKRKDEHANGGEKSRSEVQEDDDDGSEEGDSEEDEEEERIRKSIVKEDKGEEFNPAALRSYQVQRRAYFYAVVTCSSPQCAEAIYRAVDGTEYLSSKCDFDLRFVPDSMDFSFDRPRETCDLVPDGYRANQSVVGALQHSKVKLTWDPDDNERKEVQKRAFSGSKAAINENDFRAYLGSDSSSEDEGTEEVGPQYVESTGQDDSTTATSSTTQKLPKKELEAQKMRALLGLGPDLTSRKSSKKEAAPVGDMQVTFSAGLSDPTKGGSVFENEPEREETTVEKYIRKEKERKARRREKLKSTRSGAVQEDKEEEAGDEAEQDYETHEPADLGFDDPFFTRTEEDEAAARKEAKRQSKKRKRGSQPTASDTEEGPSTQRAELERLISGSSPPAGTTDPPIHHFNMTDLSLAEKLSSKTNGKPLKKKMKKKLSARTQAALLAKENDAFEMNVKDPRFGAVYERSEFAVDPSHPRFKGTVGMRRVLEEGRRRRGGKEKSG